MAVRALLDELGWCAPSDAPFVRVQDPRILRMGWNRYGFLLGSQGTRFTVHHLDVGPITYEFVSDDPGGIRTAFMAEDLQIAARNAIAEITKSENVIQGLPSALSGTLSSYVHALILWSACVSRGLQSEAELLWEGLPEKIRTRNSLVRSVVFRKDVEQRLTIDITNPGLSWNDLLASHDRVLRLIPDPSYQVKRRRDLIQHMLKRRDLASMGGPPFDSSKLVAALCDQYVPGALRPGAFSLPPRVPRADYGPQPAEALVALGLDAVPALIDALDDSTPTRSVWYSSRLGGFYGVDTVADVAEGILITISGIVPRGQSNHAFWRLWHTTAKQVGIDVAWRKWRQDAGKGWLVGGPPFPYDHPGACREEMERDRALSGW